MIVTWFEKIDQKEPNHVTKEALTTTVNPSIRKSGRSSNSWEKQMNDYRKHGIKTEEREKRSDYRRRFRSANPRN